MDFATVLFQGDDNTGKNMFLSLDSNRKVNKKEIPQILIKECKMHYQCSSVKRNKQVTVKQL